MEFALSVLLTVIVGYLGWKLLKVVHMYLGWRQIFKNKSVTPIGPEHPLMGHLPLFKDSGDIFQRMKEVTHKTKTKVIGVWVSFLFPVVVAVHPDTVKVLLKSSEPKPLYPGAIYNFLLPWLGEGLLTGYGKKWERNRRLLTPAFHFDILRPYVKTYNQVADILLEKFAASKPLGTVEVYEPVGLAAFDTMLQCAFSYNSNVQEEGSDHPYVNAVKQIGYLIEERSLEPLQFFYPIYMLTASGRKFSNYAKYVHMFDEEIIRKRQKALEKDKSLVQKRRLDFLDILLTAKDENGEGLTFGEIRDEVDTFLFEGHDTTASAITWAIYNLAKHPDEQDKLFQEAVDVMGDREDVEWDDLSKFKRLGMFIRESMRYSTPVPAISRVTTKETVLDGAVIPKGIQVLLNLHVIHNRPDIWENPEEFNPDRFEDSKVKLRDPYMHVPFSAGPRNCIGQHFALDEIKVTLVKVVRRFKLRVDPDNVPVQYPVIVMRPVENGVHVFFDDRKKQIIETDIF